MTRKLRYAAAFSLGTFLCLLLAASGDQFGWNRLIGLMTNGIYYADNFPMIQRQIDRCLADVTGSIQSGCIVQLTKGLYENNGVTIHLAGTGSAATGRAGVILRGVGGGSAAGVAGNPNSGTIIKATTNAVPVIDVGACMGCMIEDLTIAGEDLATIGVDFLAPESTPTTRFVMRNVAMYEINGYGIRTATTGQVDTLLFENVSVRDSDGCYQQRWRQNIGVILSNFDCSGQGAATLPLFDIDAGEFNLRDSFVAAKNNEVAFDFGTTGLGRVMIDGNQIEFGVSTTAKIFNFNAGDGTNTNEVTISSNHFVYDANGNTLFDVVRRGGFTVANNIVQNTCGTCGGVDRSFTASFKVDQGGTASANNKLYLSWTGNVQVNSRAADALQPERFIPTLVINAQGVWPTVLGPTVSQTGGLPLPCYEGEIGSDYGAAAGARVQTCIGGVWSAP